MLDQQPVYRPAARIVLIDPSDRVLLFRTDVRRKPLWITPGGGLDPGESFEQAAERELWEETGISAKIGPCVWRRRHVFEFNGALLDEDERIFVARTDITDVSKANWLPHEHDFMTAHHWWSVGEIATSDDWFAPRRIASLLPAILAGHYPDEPIDCGA